MSEPTRLPSAAVLAEECAAKYEEVTGTPLSEALKADLEKRSDKERIVKVFLKLKFSDFKTTTKECAGAEINPAAYIPLLEEAFERNPNPVRLLGVGVRFEDASRLDERQLELFSN